MTDIRKLTFVLLCALTVVVGCGASGSGGSTSSGSATKQLSGTVTVPGTSNMMEAHKGQHCNSQAGYDDVGAGATVTVKNDTGRIIGTGRLEAGTFAQGWRAVQSDSSQSGDAPCRMAFSLSVPDSATFYSLTIGHRGEQNYSHADLAAKGWHVDLSIG